MQVDYFRTLSIKPVYFSSCITVGRLRRVKLHSCSLKLHPSTRILAIMPEKLGSMGKSGSRLVTSHQS